MPMRSVPLILVASTSSAYAEEVATRLRHDGSVVYVTHSAEGCLRVATSVEPDLILLDPRLPQWVDRLLRAHPTSARAQILHLSETPAPRSAEPVLHAA
jgi:DNA-binding response OmpR family regulator